MSDDARKLWEEKLAFLQAEEAKAVDPDQKFKLKKDIAAAKAKLKELGAASVEIDETRPRISTSRLPHGTEHLVGREEELGRLEEAFAEPGTHVVSIVAWGGVGKTALAVEWMARLAQRDWPAVERYFDWSFYSQGTREQGAASADTFIDAALKHFGDPDPQAGSAWDRGERLARLVAEQSTVLVLDGLEPLQHPPGPMAGQLKDPALQALLRGLAQRPFTGLCVVTTREPVADLAPFHGKTVREWQLERLSDEAGAELLRQACAEGAEAELRKASKEVGGHALTLQLIGGYVAVAHGGDIRRRDLFGFQEADAEIQGGHAFRVIAAYERWLNSSRSGHTSRESDLGTRELAVLRLLGLFDRPADAGCLAALRKEPVIKGLTDPLVGLTDAEWNTALKHLQSLGLITLDLHQSAIPNPRSAIIDAHPLIREYFAKQLQEHQPKAWRAAHRRLYEHLTETTPHQPDTLDGLQPLYQAVAHGCQAGLHQKVLEEVYEHRIKRGTEFHSTDKLGAFGADLAAVACFFEERWVRLAPSVARVDSCRLFWHAAYRLRALGRLIEAISPMRERMEMHIEDNEWKKAAKSAGTMSGLQLTLGEVATAARVAEQAVAFADRSEDFLERAKQRAKIADCLHQSGRRAQALKRFAEAEHMQASRQPQYPLLYSRPGFRYCDLLLAEAERTAWQTVVQRPNVRSQRSKLLKVCREVAERAAKTLKSAEVQDIPLDIALDHLTLGRAALYGALLGHSSLGIGNSKVSFHLSAAVDHLHKAGRMDHLPRGLLTRALLLHVQGDAEGAQTDGPPEADLDEAWEIAERGPMRLHMADILLHRARLFRDTAALAEARKLIEKRGYWRRKEELEDAEEAAENWPRPSSYEIGKRPPTPFYKRLPALLPMKWVTVAASLLAAITVASLLWPKGEPPRPQDQEPKEHRPMAPSGIPEDRRGLQEIAGCENAHRTMDIVFIHGLGGDSWTTWMANKDDVGTLWPRWLAQDLPPVGVWTLGYAASSSRWKEESMPLADRGNQVLDLLHNGGVGKRPLVFITHSMGGIVAKQLLRHAESFGVDRWEAISKQTKGIAFIATPHSGAHIANFAEFARAFYRTNEQVAELAAHEPRLRELHGWFLDYQRRRNVICRSYSEKRDVRPEIPLLGVKLPKGMLVVDDSSAEPNIPRERAIPLDEDHISICKPASRHAQLYMSILRFLKECLEASTDADARRDTSDLAEQKEQETGAVDPKPTDGEAAHSEQEMLVTLAKLPAALFEEIVFRFDKDNVVPGKASPQRERAIELLRLARSRENGLSDLRELMKSIGR